MALIVRNFKIDWTWTGDDSSLRGFSVVIVKSGDYSVIVASQEMAPTDRTCTLMGVTVDPAIQYIAGVQAHYVGKDSDWVSSTGLTVPDDGTAHISNDSITESNLVGTGRVWTVAPESGATVGAAWGVNIVNQPTSLADLDPAISSAITDLQAQTDNKLAVFVQATTPSWTDANANHVGDSWYNTTDLKWYKYNGTSWVVQDSSIYNLNDLASSKTTIHYASGTSTPASYLGVLNDFCLYKNTSTGVMTYYKKTGTSTWTAQPGSYVDGADVTASAVGSVAASSFPAAVQNANTTYTELQGTKPPTDADNTVTRLATAGALALKGTLIPENTGALKVGNILWNTTSGAYSSGTGIAITEAGIIGANSSGISFSIDTSGNAIFKGDITGASGSFSGTVSASNVTAGTITGSTLQTASSGKRFVVSASDGEAHFYDSSGVEQISLGEATSGSDSWLGVFGTTSNTLNGVIGISASNYGACGYCTGDGGDGVYGYSTGDGGTGVRGYAFGTDSSGVVGDGVWAGVYANGNSYGVFAEGGLVGVYGEGARFGAKLFHTSTGNGNWGGIGANTLSYPTEITTTYGGGIAGYSSETSITSFGVLGKGRNGVGATSSISGGAGVLATHTLTSGVNYGVFSKCDSASGYDFYAAGAGLNGPFTGAHDSVVLAGSCEPGDILVDVQLLNAASVVNTLCLQEKSSVKRQKSVIGVYVAGERIMSLPEQAEDGSVIDGTTEKIVTQLQAAETFDDFLEIVRVSNFPAGLNERFRDTPTDDTFGQYRDLLVSLIQTHEWARMASLGEGMINVVAEGGNIEAGDYICSSSAPGKGMKQDDDLLHNYTVAKAREDVVWTAEEIAENAVKMIACTYHCG